MIALITGMFVFATIVLLFYQYSPGARSSPQAPRGERLPEYLFSVNLLSASLSELRKLYHLYKSTEKEEVLYRYRKERIAKRWKLRKEKRMAKETEQRNIELTERLESAGIDASRLTRGDLENLLRAVRR